MGNRDWSVLRSELSLNRLWAMYDFEIHDFRAGLTKTDYMNNTKNLREKFHAKFHTWINGSTLNTISGLDTFPERDMIIGVTHLLDDIHITNGDRVVVLAEEYLYHKRIRPNIKIRELSTLQHGDYLILSMPFAGTGDIHPDTLPILDRCEELGIPVTIDSAWYGCTSGVNFNFDHPAIQNFGFSLSKSLCMGSDRVGLRYSRKRNPGPVTILNDYGMGIEILMWYAIACMDQFPVDFLQKKYGVFYREACEHLGLESTKSIHVAWGNRPDRKAGPIGMRQVLLTMEEDSHR